ncbi:amine oxidase [Longibacter salinarum]|uniref:Amine oxidase n=1 Tax=Longibacter salinarum TaxID=1850348 RepID=A0A2A8D0C6_9BACT|nr:FAD-dependent oxidoreductase [Longibacter salinarum]PEN14283.1 amine oxidase [Longibacter salinarum]
MSKDIADEQRITILGGGPAGLAMGMYGRRERLDVQLYEANNEVGGNARTLRLGPFRYDTGAHRWHDKDAEITADVKALLGDDLRLVDAPSQICWRGRRIDFPLAPYDLMRKLPWSLLGRISREQFSIPRVSVGAEHFHEMALQSYGPTLANLFLLNYTEKLWGTDSSELSPRVAGDRLEGLDLKTFFLEAFGSRIGKARHLDGSFYYPKYGYGQITDATADAAGRENIRTGARITRLVHDGRRIMHVEVNGEEIADVETVVSTLPLTILLRQLHPAPPEEVLALADSIRFRNLRLVVLGLDRPHVTRNASLYFPERSVPFTRLYEPKNRSADTAPADQTVVVLERPCQSDDDAWTQPDDALFEAACDLLETQGLAHRDEVVAREHHAMPFAYPILEVGAADVAAEIRDYLDRFENLHLLGRSAGFAYTHVHELYAEAKALAGELVGSAVAR